MQTRPEGAFLHALKAETHSLFLLSGHGGRSFTLVLYTCTNVHDNRYTRIIYVRVVDYIIIAVLGRSGRINERVEKTHTHTHTFLNFGKKIRTQMFMKS